MARLCLASGAGGRYKPARRHEDPLCHGDADRRCRALDRAAVLPDRALSRRPLHHRRRARSRRRSSRRCRASSASSSSRSSAWRCIGSALYRAVAADALGPGRSICAARRLPICCGRASGASRQGRLRDEHRVKQLARLFASRSAAGAASLDRAAARAKRAAALVPPGGPVLAIGPAANWRGKEWRAERFAELAQRLTAPGGRSAGRARRRAGGGARARAGGAGDRRAAGRRAASISSADVDLLTAAAVLKRARCSSATTPASCISPPPSARRRSASSGRARSTQYAPWGPRTAVVADRDPAPRMIFRPISITAPPTR